MKFFTLKLRTSLSLGHEHDPVPWRAYQWHRNVYIQLFFRQRNMTFAKVRAYAARPRFFVRYSEYST